MHSFPQLPLSACNALATTAAFPSFILSYSTAHILTFTHRAPFESRRREKVLFGHMHALRALGAARGARNLFIVEERSDSPTPLSLKAEHLHLGQGTSAMPGATIAVSGCNRAPVRWDFRISQLAKRPESSPDGRIRSPDSCFTVYCESALINGTPRPPEVCSCAMSWDRDLIHVHMQAALCMAPAQRGCRFHIAWDAQG
ncbi:uncharacterized protein BDZ99DRAFT_555103 [Mytilinidion resinicola]|uniref:Uncharacterized protein n=1 Tax=Mytilinidion resinicola TaxID=574789 RepID=A0A6A6Z0A1_9PEZI|nr:uncharacterized protein BDZ99DRAFT_555103 [Mytilinidion resinicola]KAF2814430.1 hypothetical protein BDZ99DRAFT_555103 [Mytilinidion resinicola]